MTTPDQPALTFRPGTAEDSYAVFCVFEEALADLNRRMGLTEPTSWSDPEALARMWQERRSLFEHLARTADQFWLAERDGRAIGYARSTLHDGVRELTELFVAPGAQAAGAGRELLARAMPPGSARRVIIASPDLRAQALYLRSGVHVQFSMYYFWRVPEPTSISSDLTFEPIAASPETLEQLAALDMALLDYRRDADHAWLLADRQGYFYRRGGELVGYGYAGKSNGPFALLDSADFPAVLAHAEREAAVAGRDHFGLDVPLVNHAAVEYLLARRFRIDNFTTTLMSNVAFGRFANYVGTSPSFIL
jgi:GNAT superfamily N-acetyltransferase